MTYGSLFSGIGGLDLGVEMATGATPLWHAESNPYARAVLTKHWPGVHCYEDVKDVNESAARPDIICGGFPCQDISLAGSGEGIDGKRSGLWSEFARIIGVLRPRCVFVENVAALRIRGLDRVLGDLAACEYDAEWSVLRATDVGAPHIRRRMFILAYTESEPIGTGFRESEPKGIGGRRSGDSSSADSSVADTGGERCEEHGRAGAAQAQFAPLEREGDARKSTHAVARSNRADDIGRVGRGTVAAHDWGAEPDVGRVADGVPSRVDRIRVLGNAVVPQQAALAFRELAKRADL